MFGSVQSNTTFNAGFCAYDPPRVTPLSFKGKLNFQDMGDGLVQFNWQKRSGTGNEVDLVLVRGTASFERVSACTTGRAYALLVEESEPYFFWMQDKSEENDIERCNAINEVLGSEYREGEAGEIGGLEGEIIAAQLGGENITLKDVLSGQRLTGLLANPEIAEKLLRHCPEGTEIADLPELIHSPQFKSAVQEFDQALQNGLLPLLLTQMGIPLEMADGQDGLLGLLRAVDAIEDEEEDEVQDMEE